ncbi:MAG: hypothetical protein ABJE47_06455 [bacterium]
MLIEKGDADRVVELVTRLGYRAEASWTSGALGARHCATRYGSVARLGAERAFAPVSTLCTTYSVSPFRRPN